MSPPNAHAEKQRPGTAKSIMDCAISLLAETGFSAMSMRCLARRVGVLPGSLYFHVASKQDLLADVISELLDSRMAEWRAKSHSLAVNEQLCEFTRFVLSRQLSHASQDNIVRYESRHLDVDQRRSIAFKQQAFMNELASIIAEGERNGLDRAGDPTMSAQCVFALLDGAQSIREIRPNISEAELHVLLLERVLRLLNA
ncbi:TetR/AcrR family transcriptional regulator [Pseudomonas fluorescens]|uniref:TetR/AcrR family transcriptional regulator n=1 Tax=Pseudomonas fluorescens TaxID=294 RepID=UPI003F9DBE32